MSSEAIAPYGSSGRSTHDRVVMEHRSLGCAVDADGARDRSRHRQRDLYFRYRLQHSAGAGQARASDRAGAGADISNPAAQPSGLADRPDRSRPDREGLCIFVGRHHPDRGRALSDRQATHEIHQEVEAQEDGPAGASHKAAFFLVIVEIIIIDIVFSLDSIITAIGMAQDLAIMIAAVIIACVVMYAASGPVARFVAEHPTTKMLALAFLVLIGVALVADGFKFHIPRGYIYFAIAFSAAVEFFNVLAKRNRRKARG